MTYFDKVDEFVKREEKSTEEKIEEKIEVKEERVEKSNVVLVAQVERDECTSMCDQFFDTAFNGRIASVMPRFSSPSVWKDDDKDVQIGIISGRSGSAKSAIATLYFGRPIHVMNDVRWLSLIHI